MSWLGSLLGGLIATLWQKLFPPKTAADQRADDLQAALEAEKRMNKAAAKAPTNKAELIKTLRSGTITVLLCLMAGCANSVGVACPTPRDWTPAQQDEIAANLAVLPDTSPLVAVGVEWSRLRAESKACLENSGGL